MYRDHAELIAYLDHEVQPTFRSLVDDNFKKSLTLAAASYFEHELTKILLEFCNIVSHGHPELTAFVRAKAVERQYCTYFNWDSRNANNFFGLFGREFKLRAQDRVKADAKLDEAIKAFLEIGELRNRMVHEDYAIFLQTKSAREVYDLYQLALPFLVYVEAELCVAGPP
jgi:hypothetical protein